METAPNSAKTPKAKQDFAERAHRVASHLPYELDGITTALFATVVPAERLNTLYISALREHAQAVRASGSWLVLAEGAEATAKAQEKDAASERYLRWGQRRYVSNHILSEFRGKKLAGKI